MHNIIYQNDKILDETSTSKTRKFNKQKKGNQGTFSTFEGAEYISNVAAAISGGIESPLQIILQVMTNSTDFKLNQVYFGISDAYNLKLQLFPIS